MPDSGHALRVAALRLLARRDHSRAEMKAKLAAGAESEEELDSVLDALPVSYTHLDVYKRQVHAGGHVKADADGQHQVEDDEPDQHAVQPQRKMLILREL